MVLVIFIARTLLPIDLYAARRKPLKGFELAGSSVTEFDFGFLQTKEDFPFIGVIKEISFVITFDLDINDL